MEQELLLTAEEEAMLCGEHGIDSQRISALCDAEQIRIIRCQLGCF